MNEKIKLLILGFLLLTFTFLIISPGKENTVTGGAEKAAGALPVNAKFTRIQNERLENKEGRTFAPPVNIFSEKRLKKEVVLFNNIPKEAPRIEPPVIIPIPAVEIPKPAEIIQPPQPVVVSILNNVQFLGFVSKGPKQVVFLSFENNILLGKVGDIIEGRIYVKAAGDNFVILQDINTKEEKKLETNS